jgi:hypothetical protein
MIQWPWISRKKHQEKIMLLEQDLRSAKASAIHYEREAERIKYFGFNICISHDPENITVRVEQGFKPELVRDFIKNKGFIKHECEDMVKRLMIYIEEYSKTGKNIERRF